MWEIDELFDIDHHVRHSALPKPGRVRELLDLVSRLHGTLLACERPLWEAHLIEGLRDGRVAMYTKTHHALVDGVSAMRLLASTMSTDPDQRGMPAPCGPTGRARSPAPPPSRCGWRDLPQQVVRGAFAISAEAAGMPSALVTTLRRGYSNETSSVSLYAPRTILNQPITGSRRFAAQDWPLERLRAIGKATGTTINDVVLAMCSGALRAYLLELDALPDTGLVAMVPVGLNAKQSHIASAEGGNAVGSVMVQLATELADPADRLSAIHASMRDGKQALSSMTPMQIQAMSALGQAPAVLPSMLRMHGIMRPAYNVVISNVPGSAHHAVPQRRAARGHLPAVDPDQRDGAQHHLHVVRRQDVLRAHRLPAHRAPAPAAARPPRRRGRRAGARGRRPLTRDRRHGAGVRPLTTPWSVGCRHVALSVVTPTMPSRARTPTTPGGTPCFHRPLSGSPTAARCATG